MIHPRIQKEFYNGKPHMEQFAHAYENSKNPLCYNGDIFTVEDFKKLSKAFPKLEAVMLGRGNVSQSRFAGGNKRRRKSGQKTDKGIS